MTHHTAKANLEKGSPWPPGAIPTESHSGLTSGTLMNLTHTLDLLPRAQVLLYHSIINKDLDEVLLFRANVQIVPVGKVLVPSELQTLTKDLDVAVKCGTFPNLVQVVGSLQKN